MSQSDVVEAGDHPCDVDVAALRAAGYSTISPVVITGMDAVQNLTVTPGAVVAGVTTVATFDLAGAVDRV